MKNTETKNSIRVIYKHIRPPKLEKIHLPQGTNTNTIIKYTFGNFLDGFADFCNVSYKNAIQYLCEYLNIDLQSFTKDDLALIKSKENDIKTEYCDFYNTLYIYLHNKRRNSYLTNGFIKAALPYFYTFCEKRL